MTRQVYILTLTMMTLSFVGCSMCCGPFDFDYPTYGGIHQRSDPSYGRVGSVFSDPNAVASGPSSDSNLKPHPEPKDQRDLEVDDDPLERADEDLDDDLEGLDEDLEELDRKLDELDDVDQPRDDLESIEPLEDINATRVNGNRAQSIDRRRSASPRRGFRYR